MTNKLPKFDFRFEPHRWGFHTSLVYFQWRKPISETKTNVIFYLTVSYSRRIETLSNKKWFTFAIAALERDVKESSWTAKGFICLFEKL